MSYQDLIKSQKLKIRSLIFEISRKWGGDDKSFLDGYIADVLRENREDLPKVIEYFEMLAKQSPPSGVTPMEENHGKMCKCGYMPVFCSCGKIDPDDFIEI